MGRLGLILVVFLTSYTLQAQEGVDQSPITGLSIEYGPNLGTTHTDPQGTKHFYVHSTATIHNDTTVPVRLEFALASTYSFPSLCEGEEYKAFVLPDALTPDTATIYNNIVNGQHDFLDDPLTQPNRQSKTLNPGDYTVITVGTLTQIPSNCAPVPRAIFSIDDRDIHQTCGVKNNAAISTALSPQIGIRLEHYKNRKFIAPADACTTIPIATISYPLSTVQFLDQIDQKVPKILRNYSIPGAAIAIIEDGEIVMQKGYGFANMESGEKVTSKTGFNIGSISKSVAAWGVMKLVQEGKIELDAPAETYLTRWKIPDSEFDSREVTVRRLLSHTAGLSLHSVSAGPPYTNLPTLEDWLLGKNDGLGPVEIILEPGSRYRYSGGGSGVLQLIVEEVTGQSFEKYMQEQVLDPLGMTNSSYRINDDILAKSATPYDEYNEASDFERFTVQAGAGLHTTLEDLTRYAMASMYRHSDNHAYNPVLSPKYIQDMMEPVLPNGNWRWGMGYQTEYRGDSFVLSGHSGSNAGWHANFRINPESNDGFVVLTNAGSGYGLCNQIMCDWVEWKTGELLGNWCRPKTPIDTKIKQLIDKNGLAGISEAYKELQKTQSDVYDFSENQLNELGYYYLSKGRLKEAIVIFKINVDAFPYAFNVYDSYGEALLANGDSALAIVNYQESVKLNPDNQNGIDILRSLGESTEDLLFKMPKEYLNRLAGEYKGEDDETWSILVEVKDGVLQCVDKYYNFTLVPIGDDKFVNPRFGALWRFDISGPDIDPIMRFGNRTFIKVK